MNREMLYAALILVLLPISSQTDEDVVEPVTVSSVVDEVENPSLSMSQSSASACCGVKEMKQLVKEQQETRSRLTETANLLMQLVQEDKEESGVQAEILKLLRGMKETQVAQLTHVGNMARQHSLLVENHQALLFQVSRIGSMLQERSRQSRADSVFRVPQDRVLVQEEGSDILLGCVPLIPDATHFTLLLVPGSALPPDLNFTVDVTQGIVIRAVRLNHSGEYVCTVRVNATRQDSPGFVIAVKKKVRFPPVVSVEVDECVRIAGEMLQLTCNTSNPDHTFTTRWHHFRKQALQEEKTRKTMGNVVYLTSVVTLPQLNKYDAGNLTCISTNMAGRNYATVSLRVTEKPFLSLTPLKPRGLNPMLELMEGDMMELSVEIDAYPPIQEGRWSTPQPTNSSIIVDTLSTVHRSYRQVASLLIKRIRGDERGWYSFHARGANTNATIHFKVFIYQRPVVVIDQVNGSLTCVSLGYPAPAVNWQQCEKLHHISVGCDTNTSVVALQSEQHTLQPADEFQPYTVVSVLQTRLSNVTVECVSMNVVGVGRSTITLLPPHYVSQPPPDLWTSVIFLTIITAASITATLLSILLGVCVYRCKQTPKYEVRWKIIEVSDGNSYLYIDPMQLPYNAKWEFPRDRLTFGQVLGSGAFGKVVEAMALGLEKEDCLTQVAVKMLKASAHSEEKEALMCELKILSHLGSHTNIVNLLGACTHGGPVLLITEFCCHGDLLNFLRRKVSSFIHSASYTHETSNIYRNLTEQQNHQRRNEVNSYVDMQQGQSSENCIHRGNSGGAQGDPSELTIQHLLKFSSHVAQGLNFLSSRNCIHRDVAARNVLVSDSLVAKICDFGLARDIMNDSNYVVRGNARLPVKWMSPESIFECLYTVQSDVWSYGILLWEIFSLGRNPYPDMVVDARFYKMIRCGYQMSQPDFAPDEMYQIMRMCWSLEPTSRPTFSIMVQMIRALQDETTEQVSAQQLQQYENLQQELGSTECVTDKTNMDKTPEEQRPLTHSNNYQLY